MWARRAVVRAPWRRVLGQTGPRRCQRGATSATSTPGEFDTHTVFNQASPYGEYNAFTEDKVLVNAVERWGGSAGVPHLTQFGSLIGSDHMRYLADTANRFGPVLRSHDKFGNQVSQAEFHPSYHELMSLGLTNQVSSYAWTHADQPGAHVIRAALGYLQYQGESGVSCPMSMTFASVPALEQQSDLAAIWKPKLTAAQYDGRDVPVSEKGGATMGMSMTEKQGGSDVRANTTRATPVDHAGPGQPYHLVGHKWFTSAPMCDAFLTLANTYEGSSCFLVPRWLPDGTRNTGFRVMRLKDKLGDRSNASSEVEYSNAVGYLVGDPGRGIANILNMVVHTRLDCALGSAGLIRQAVRHAVHHTRARSAFGAQLAQQPAMSMVLADLAVESEAATLTALRIAHAFDEAVAAGDMSSREEMLRRSATAVAKYWVCKRAPAVVYEAMECHGGNGYAEEWGMARLFRQSPLNSIWEGSGNVICLDVLRAMAREPQSIAAFVDEVSKAEGMDGRFDRLLDNLRRMLSSADMRDPVLAQAHARHLVDTMALALQTSLMLTYGNEDSAEHFCATRLGRDGTWNYGSLSPSADGHADLARSNAIVDRFL